MYIDRNIIQDYPFNGVFYTVGVDESKPLDQQVEEKVVLFETMCDISEASHSWSGDFIFAKYVVYFPFDKDSEIKVRLGDLFESNMYGLNINGKVVGVFPSQLGGVSVYIQDSDA